MLKYVLFIFSLSTAIASQPKNVFCAVKKIQMSFSYYDGEQNLNDKFLHCTFSCNIATSCGPLVAKSIGVIKEIADLVDGNPNSHGEIADIKANMQGIWLGVRSPFSSLSQCHQSCLDHFDLYY